MEAFIFWSGWIFALGGFLFGLWQHSVAASDRRALALVRRRADAPYLAPSPQRFEYVHDDTHDPGSISLWRASGQNVLCAAHHEVGDQVGEGDPVIFVVENRGQPCAGIRVKLDGEPAHLLREPDFQGALGLYFIKYPFRPALRGKEQKVEVWFECCGVQDTHVYRTAHGLRVLDRVDPL